MGLKKGSFCLGGSALTLEGHILHDGITGKYYIHMDNCLNESDNVGEEGLLRFVSYEVNPETVCQYTDANDREGRKIFEHDIVEEDGAIGRLIAHICAMNSISGMVK